MGYREYPRGFCMDRLLKVMLHKTIRNTALCNTALRNTALHNTALQHCCDMASNGCNIVPTLQRCVVQKIVVANRLV